MEKYTSICEELNVRLKNLPSDKKKRKLKYSKRKLKVSQ